jgi:hypothetical protein
MEETKWCPAHGYPLPCDKCGYTGKPKIKMEELKLERISEAKRAEIFNGWAEIGVQLISDIQNRTADAQLQADQQVVDKLKAEIAQLKETIKSYHDTYVKGGNTGFKL